MLYEGAIWQLRLKHLRSRRCKQRLFQSSSLRPRHGLTRAACLERSQRSPPKVHPRVESPA